MFRFLPQNISYFNPISISKNLKIQNNKINYKQTSNILNMDIGTVRAMYQATNLASLGSGVEGYFVQKKYVDIAKLRLEKVYASRQKSSSKPTNVSEKTTFIDDIQKRQAKLPGPTSYEFKDYQSKSKTQSVIHPGTRKTIFDDIENITKKYNYPAPVKYSKIETDVDKSKLKSNMGKADNSNFLESSMRSSLDAPGVGNYNSNKSIFGEKKGNRWVQKKNKSKSQAKTKLPPVGTYDPRPVDFPLFSSLASLDKGRSKSYFPRTQRFKSANKKDIPYYNVLSEWGLKDKGAKKDILSKVTKTAGHHSVYY